MAEKTICEVCGKKIKKTQIAIPVYHGKRTNHYRLMYRHDDCDNLGEEEGQIEED